MDNTMQQKKLYRLLAYDSEARKDQTCNLRQIGHFPGCASFIRYRIHTSDRCYTGRL